MKNNFILILLMSFLTMSGYSQKCKTEKDPITGVKTSTFMNKYQTLKYIYKGGEDIEFYTTFNYTGEQNSKFGIGSEVIIKLKDGSILNLHSVKDAMPQSKVRANQYGATVYTQYTFAFILDKEQINLLANSKVSFIRYPAADGGYTDIDIKGFGKIYAKKITKGAECMLENLDPEK